MNDIAKHVFLYLIDLVLDTWNFKSIIACTFL